MEELPKAAAEHESLLRRAWEMGRRRWPQVDLPADLFMRHLIRLLPELSAGAPLAPLFEELALEELYLACACVHDMPSAIEALERDYLAKLPALLGYLKLPTALLDDVCQSVRMHLLLRTAEARPRLAEYTGRGALLSWIRIIAVRMALRQRASDRETPEDDVLAALEALPTPGPDAEFDLIKRRYRREFRQAMREAFAALSSDQRHLLRLHFIERLPTTRLGPLFGVDQSTISRWLKSARQAVYEETKRRLQERLGLSSNDFKSLLAAIDSQFDLSLSQVLHEED
jgi:RNA polymerase sigma-70 factor (ECF subfamily)